MPEDKSDDYVPEVGRRFLADRYSQVGTGNVAGLSFGSDKWKYPYEATIEHPGEFVRRAEGGIGLTPGMRDAVFGPPDKDPWSDGPIQGLMSWVYSPGGPGFGTGGSTRVAYMPTQEDFRKNSPPLVQWGPF